MMIDKGTLARFAMRLHRFYYCGIPKEFYNPARALTVMVGVRFFQHPGRRFRMQREKE